MSRSTYAALFAVIGTKHGSGDGSTTFNLPNLANRFVEGTTSIGSAGTFKSAGLPNITGILQGGWKNTIYDSIPSGAMTVTTITTSPAVFSDAKSGLNRVMKLNAATSNSHFGASSSVQPPAIALLPCIKS